jgi:type IV pilus assembly protein PilE
MLHDMHGANLAGANDFPNIVRGISPTSFSPRKNAANGARFSGGSRCGRENRSPLTQRGFTLIELIVTVTIVAILTSVALPAYHDYVTRSKIPDATAALSAKRVQLEQYFQDNHTFAGAPACNNDATTSSYFTFTCVGVVDANNYMLQATGGNGGNQSMAGFTYTVNQSYTKTSAIVAPARTNWIAASPSCWITGPGGSC